MKKKLLLISLLSGVLLACLIFSMIYFMMDNGNKKNKNSSESKELMSMTVQINGKESKVLLEENDTAREFFNKLPLTITMYELNGNEKYFYFGSSFPNHPVSLENVEAGDLMLYGDNCLVLFYKTFPTSYSYTKLGKLVDPSILEEIGDSNLTITFTK